MRHKSYFPLLLLGMFVLLFNPRWGKGCNGGYGCNPPKGHRYKPVIYLYPEAKARVKVKIKYKGDLTVTYPEYNNGWEVDAYPDGKLEDISTEREYSYLFWEGKDSAIAPVRTVYDRGFVVKGDSVQYFLQEKLAAIGLLPKEYNEFIVFWYPILKQNKYNFIYFNVGEEYNEISTMEIDPEPDAILRVFMYYQAMDAYVNVSPQIFESFSREGFTVVEWGGGPFTTKIIVKENQPEN